MKKLRFAVLVVMLGIVTCGFYLLGYREATKEHSLDFGDANDFGLKWSETNDFNSVASDLYIYTNSGKHLRISVDDELQITGDANMSEAAEVFFCEHIKEMADAYIKREVFEGYITFDGESSFAVISECPHCGRSLLDTEPLVDK